MSRAFMKEGEAPEPRCPGCDALGDPVGAATLAAQLPADARKTLGDKALYCSNSTCRTAYFDAWGAAVAADRLKSVSYPKNPDGLLCPCFGIGAAQIVADARDGKKERMKDLVERAKGPEAKCLEKCPDGQPCVPRAMRLFREHFAG